MKDQIRLSHAIGLTNIKTRIINNGINASTSSVTPDGKKTCRVKGYIEEGFLYLNIEMEDILCVKVELLKRKMVELDNENNVDELAFQ